MRIDHHAYQRGTRVAAFGLLVQFFITLVLMIFQIISRDTALELASYYTALGLLVWLSLIVLLHQHKLERLEALEEDELAAARAGTSSVFDPTSEDLKVASRRLGLMYKWLMPSVSLVLAIAMSGLVWLIYRYMQRAGDALAAGGTQIHHTPEVGWAIAICLFFALVAFIFSRFVAGMAKQPAWQNLRGGAGYMIGNALIMLIVAAGLGFRVFGNEQVIVVIAKWVIPIFIALCALEIVLNFILNIYRPRIPGEVPRAAFDSRVLSQLAAPDSIVRSLNEAIDYQFGFDITSSWGYKLLIRSFVWLLAIGVGVMVLLNTMVVVEPHQQAMRLRFGQIVGEVHEPGIMWKWPWPVETARIYDVSTLRELNLTARRTRETAGQPHLWTAEYRTVGDLDPFIVGSASLHLDDVDRKFLEERVEEIVAAEEALVEEPLEPLEETPRAEQLPDPTVTHVFSLLDGEISLHYRILRTADGSGLMNYLRFAPDTGVGRRDLTMRERALKAIALREVTQHLSRLTIDEALSLSRATLAEDLRGRIQAAFNRGPRPAGVEVVSVNIPMMRPRGETAARYESLSVERQNAQARTEMARREIVTSLTVLAGDPERARRILAAIEEWSDLRDDLGSDAAETIDKRNEIERLLVESAGRAAQLITASERDQWVELMSKRAQASRTLGQIQVYRAGPELYRAREFMRMLARTHSHVRKYVIGIDPSRVQIGADIKELNPLLDFNPSASADGENSR